MESFKLEQKIHDLQTGKRLADVAELQMQISAMEKSRWVPRGGHMKTRSTQRRAPGPGSDISSLRDTHTEGARRPAKAKEPRCGWG